MVGHAPANGSMRSKALNFGPGEFGDDDDDAVIWEDSEPCLKARRPFRLAIFSPDFSFLLNVKHRKVAPSRQDGMNAPIAAGQQKNKKRY